MPSFGTLNDSSFLGLQLPAIYFSAPLHTQLLSRSHLHHWLSKGWSGARDSTEPNLFMLTPRHICLFTFLLSGTYGGVFWRLRDDEGRGTRLTSEADRRRTQPTDWRMANRFAEIQNSAASEQTPSIFVFENTSQK